MLDQTRFRFGFRVIGGRDRERRIVDWNAAFLGHLQNDDRADITYIDKQAEVVRLQGRDDARLNALTGAFIREGATSGDRHRLLYSAACNLAEFQCPANLAYALLTPPGLDSGLSPSDVRRQIDCGMKDGSQRCA